MDHVFVELARSGCYSPDHKPGGRPGEVSDPARCDEDALAPGVPGWWCRQTLSTPVWCPGGLLQGV